MWPERLRTSPHSSDGPLRSPSVVLWGMPGVFTAALLHALRLAQIPVQALILFDQTATSHAGPIHRLSQPAAAPNEFLLHRSDHNNPIQVAWDEEIPVLVISDLTAPGVRQQVAALAADDICLHCVACFPKRIPPALLNLSPHGFLNVHPSLLPAHRGPYPVFWQLRSGTEAIGVTIHRLDHELDTGPIARQSMVALPDGVSGPEIDHILGTVGGRLLVETMCAQMSGIQRFAPQPRGGSYQSRPRRTDFSLSTHWSARHAFNFMRATAEWGHAYLIHIDGTERRLASALDFDPTATQPSPFVDHVMYVSIQFAIGVLYARLA